MCPVASTTRLFFKTNLPSFAIYFIRKPALRMGSPRPIVCTYCKNKQKSFLFKELTDEEYDVMAERLDEFDRAAYFCMICIQKIRRKIERIKKREALLREAANPHGSEDEESYSSCEEIRQRLNAHRNQVEQQNSGQQQPEQPPPRSNSS